MVKKIIVLYDAEPWRQQTFNRLWLWGRSKSQWVVIAHLLMIPDREKRGMLKGSWGGKCRFAMPRAHHRLNIFAVPVEADRVPSDPMATDAWRGLVEQGIVLDSGLAGPQAALLLPGGFSRIRVDRPQGRTVFANRVGGFSVRCPACQAGVGRELSESVTRWRNGAEAGLECPDCEALWDFHELDAQPQIAMGRFALEWRDVGGVEFSEFGNAIVGQLLGGEYRTVLSRG